MDISTEVRAEGSPRALQGRAGGIARLRGDVPAARCGHPSRRPVAACGLSWPANNRGPGRSSAKSRSGLECCLIIRRRLILEEKAISGPELRPNLGWAATGGREGSAGGVQEHSNIVTFTGAAGEGRSHRPPDSVVSPSSWCTMPPRPRTFRFGPAWYEGQSPGP